VTVELTFTPVRDGYSVIPTYPIREAKFDGAATRKYTDALYLPHEVTVNWKLTSAADYTNFMGFFRTTLLESTEYFLMDLVTSIGALVPHRCRTKAGLPRLQQVSGTTFHVSATLEVEVNPTWTGLILYEEPNIIRFTHTTPRLVGPLQPGDTIQIFNSSGVHPLGTNEWVFDGSNDRASVADVLDFERTNSFSVSGWFNSDTLTETNAGRMISKADTTANQRGWFIAGAGVSGGQHVQFGLINTVVTNNIRVETTSTYSNGTLYHFVATYDGSSNGSGVKIYIDGVLQAVSIVNNNLSATTVSAAILTLGNREDGTRAFHGILAHLAVWDNELSQSDVDEIYNDGTPPNLLSVSAASGLVGWWRLDGTDVVTAGGINDHSVSNNDASAQSGLAPTVLTDETDLNLDGIYEVDTVDPNNEITLVDPELVNANWTVLAGLGAPGQYGTEAFGNVISTLTRHPT
jgi:hypothetical protein